MRTHLTKLLAIALLSAILAHAQPNQWARVTKIQPGSNVRITFRDSTEKTKGRFVSSDDSSISITLPDGTAKTISRNSIRQLQASSKARQAAPLIGAAAGAAAIGIPASRPRFDLTSSAVALAIAGGAAAGFGLGMATRYSVIYEAP